MKLAEISNRSKKIINQLNSLYISYILDPSLYPELIELIYQCKNSNNADLNKEANIVNNKLITELIKILK
jgi:hypothetical protein